MANSVDDPVQKLAIPFDTESKSDRLRRADLMDGVACPKPQGQAVKMGNPCICIPSTPPHRNKFTVVNGPPKSHL
jgi:hypothetical protein